MRIGCFAGSFDPPTLGHSDLLQRAARQVDRLVVGVGVHPAKRPLLEASRRVALLDEECRRLGIVGAEVAAYEGATVTFAKSRGATVLLRGVRGDGDLERELAMAEVNRRNGIDTVLLPAATALRHLSSSLVREALAAGLDVAEMVPPGAAAALRR